MSDKEAELKAEGSNEEEEKRSTRKKPRIDYYEEKKVGTVEAKSGKAAGSKAEADDKEKETSAPENVSETRAESNTTDDLLGLPVEQTGLEGAAFQSRMPFDKMTQVEAACFPDLVTPLPAQKLYLHLRNRLLQMWLENPKLQLTSKDVLKRLEPPWNSDEPLVTLFLLSSSSSSLLVLKVNVGSIRVMTKLYHWLSRSWAN